MQQEAFDNYAKEYDVHFSDSLIGIAQRKIVHSYLNSISDKNRSVLEINCGTGPDAALLSQLYKDVLCTDASEKMLKICENKTNSISNCITLKSPIQELDNNINRKFNLIFSNFGGLNCLDPSELRKFSHDCKTLTHPGAELVFVIMGRKCLSETLYFLYKGKRNEAFRRKKTGGVQTEIKNSVFRTYYYSPKEIDEVFKANFKIVKTIPVGFFIPPSYLNPFFTKNKPLLSALCRLEKLSGSPAFLSNRADHFLIHLKRI